MARWRSLRERNRIFATVWDGGGRDTYDLSAYRSDLEVHLRPGRHSGFSQDQLANLGGGPNGGHARGDVFAFRDVRESRPGAADRITGDGEAAAFGGVGRHWGDVVELRRIDADATRTASSPSSS
jgi:Peptidase M10 serralysin C terminal